MGSLALFKKDKAGARRAFEKTLQLDPNSTEALYGLLVLDAEAKNFPAAKARVEARLAKTPNDPTLLMLAAQTYMEAGDLAKAEQPLLQALTVTPDSLQAYGLLGKLYIMQNKLPQAREKFAEIREARIEAGGRRDDDRDDLPDGGEQRRGAEAVREGDEPGSARAGRGQQPRLDCTPSRAATSTSRSSWRGWPRPASPTSPR